MHETELSPIPVTFFPAARIGLFVGGVVAVLSAFAMKTAPAPPPPEVAPVVVVEPVPAPTPTGPHASTGLKGPAVVNVWLQGCPDCMPAFEAWRRLVDEGVTKGMHVENIAYGRADATWAAQYHVDDNLSFDADGSRIVQPLGIGTFTTFVIDKQGAVILRDRPRDGFAGQLRDAWALANRR